MQRRLAAVVPIGVLALLASLATAPAHAEEPAPTVVCEDANNEINVNFTSGAADVNSTVFHGCVSPNIPSLVIGVVQPRPGTATGTPTDVSINVPKWTIFWYDTNNNKLTETVSNMTFTYIGPLPHEMAALALASHQTVISAGTATRTCPTSNECTYYNTTTYARGEYYFD
jgi:hypothetical protein